MNSIIKDKKGFENRLLTVALEFKENLENYKKIISVHHNDADGMSSGYIIRELLKKLGIDYYQTVNNLELPWKEVLERIEKYIIEPGAIIFSDLCPQGVLLTELRKKYLNLDIYILDHHHFQPDPDHPEDPRIYNCNPTLFGFDGLKEIAGSTLNYMFCREVDESIKKFAWVAAIGMGGDTLDHFNNYQSYNKEIIEELIELEQLEKKEGLCLYGAQHEQLNKALAYSLLPYLPQFHGNPKEAKDFLDNINIPNRIKIEELDRDQIDSIISKIKGDLFGEYLIFPKKKGILRYPFEHAELISILGAENPNLAFQVIGNKKATKDLMEKYKEYHLKLIKYLTKFLQIKRIETNNAWIIDLTGHIPKEQWSDIATFSSINQLFPENKILFIGGLNEGFIKLSVRCSVPYCEKYPKDTARKVIKRACEQLNALGGGHDLAGGIRLTPEQFNDFKNNIDKFFEHNH